MQYILGNSHLFSFRLFISVYTLFAYITVIHTGILRLPECNKVDGMFSKFHRNQRLVGSIILRFAKFNIGRCISKCLEFSECKSVNFLDYVTESMQSIGACELNYEEIASRGKSKLVYQEKSTYLETPKTQPNVCILYFYLLWNISNFDGLSIFLE